MEPQANSAPSPENLPQPTPETSVEPGSAEQAPAPAAPEVEKPKEAGNQNSGMPPPPVKSAPVAPQKENDDDKHVDLSAHSVVSDAPAIADDIDVIEKEWVDKAKSIVDNNRQDPHVQNKEVSVLKADYMKKRYGKDIKLTKD